MALDPNFAIYSQRELEIVGLAEFVDGYPVQKFTHTVDKTSHPLETGGTLTDHAVVLPSELTLTGFTSDLVPARISDTGSAAESSERPALAWQAVLNLLDQREPVEVITSWGVYNSMLIVKVDTDRNSRVAGALRFEIKLEEVLFADTDLTSLSPATTSGDAQDRPSLSDRGRQNLAEIS